MATVHPVVDDFKDRKMGPSDSFKKGTWTPHTSVLGDVARMLPPQEVKERIKSSWSTLGIVSALILTMTYPSIITPPYGVINQDNYDIVNDPVVMTYNVLNIISFTLALTIDIIVVIFMTQLDLTCSEEHTRRFLIKFAPLNEILTAIFGVSIIVLGAQVMAMTWYNYPEAVNIVTLAFWGTCIVFVAISATVVGIYNRMEVQQRGNELMEAATLGHAEAGHK